MLATVTQAFLTSRLVEESGSLTLMVCVVTIAVSATTTPTRANGPKRLCNTLVGNFSQPPRICPLLVLLVLLLMLRIICPGTMCCSLLHFHLTVNQFVAVGGCFICQIIIIMII